MISLKMSDLIEKKMKRKPPCSPPPKHCSQRRFLNRGSDHLHNPTQKMGSTYQQPPTLLVLMTVANHTMKDACNDGDILNLKFKYSKMPRAPITCHSEILREDPNLGAGVRGWIQHHSSEATKRGKTKGDGSTHQIPLQDALCEMILCQQRRLGSMQ